MITRYSPYSTEKPDDNLNLVCIFKGVDEGVTTRRVHEEPREKGLVKSRDSALQSFKFQPSGLFTRLLCLLLLLLILYVGAINLQRSWPFVDI